MWLSLVGSALVILTGEWRVGALVWPPIACGILWLLSLVWIGPPHKAARWLFLASPPVVLMLLAAASWFALSIWSP